MIYITFLLFQANSFQLAIVNDGRIAKSFAIVSFGEMQWTRTYGLGYGDGRGKGQQVSISGGQACFTLHQVNQAMMNGLEETGKY